jgi:hypothetical protein
MPTLRVITPDKADNAVFVPKHMGNSATAYKWSVRMFYKYDGSDNSVHYLIFIKDAYTNTNFVYTYEGCFWLPRYDDRAKFNGVEGTRAVEVDGLDLAKGTFQSGSAQAKYTDDQYERIKGIVDAHDGEGYKTKIKYTWG